jgi:hypothetical protein
MFAESMGFNDTLYLGLMAQMYIYWAMTIDLSLQQLFWSPIPPPRWEKEQALGV